MPYPFFLKRLFYISLIILIPHATKTTVNKRMYWILVSFILPFIISKKFLSNKVQIKTPIKLPTTTIKIGQANKWYFNASKKSNRIMHIKALVNPHPGHGMLKIFLNGHRYIFGTKKKNVTVTEIIRATVKILFLNINILPP